MLRSTRASVVTRWRARRLSEDARATLDRAPVADDGGTAMRTMVVGLDPLRVLLFGSGPLIGYGVRERKDAVDGALARLLAERTGRGVIVESRVRLRLPIVEAVSSLGGAGTVTFGVAVWAPRFGEELQHSDVERARTAIRAMLHQFRAESNIPLVVCHLPKPIGLDWRTALRRPRLVAFNHALSEEAASVAGVSAVGIGTYRPNQPSEYGPAWHRSIAEQLAPAVLRALDVPPLARLQATPSVDP
jgi:hypothetical protein